MLSEEECTEQEVVCKVPQKSRFTVLYFRVRRDCYLHVGLS